MPRLLQAFLFLTLLPLISPAQTPTQSYKIISRLPHSTTSYTEGFFFLDGRFYEGSGLNGRSSLTVTDARTGKLLQQSDLPREYFGEGIVDFGPSLYQWTWQSHIGFIYDRATLKRTGQFSYSGEGWGMTRTPTEIVTSDGSATLRFRNPATFAQTHYVVVHEKTPQGDKAVPQLNELEYVKGEIYANVWHTDRIARISPQDGHVIAWIDLAGLLPDNQRIDAESVLNGIAYDPTHDRLFVTGKQWPTIFEIKPLPSH